MMVNEAATLKLVEFNCKEKILNNNQIKDYDVEELSLLFPSAVLDVFETQLNEGSDFLECLDSDYFRLDQEGKYLKFIEEVFYLNNKKCFLSINMEINNNSTLLYRMNNLDVLDKHILLHQVKTLNESGLTTYLIEDLNLLKLFMKGMLREIFNADLSFVNFPCIIYSNYDLSIPIITTNESDMRLYFDMAKSSNLFLRSIVIPKPL